LSGRKQHYIPRSLLRGFLSEPGGRAERVWVFRRDKFFNPSLDGAAAERFFYSELPTDATKTLDDRITDYESGFSGLIRALRAAPFGLLAESRTAAEVVVHLCVRTAHLRAFMARGMEMMSLHAHALLSNDATLRNLMGVDEDDPGKSRFPGLIAETLDKDPRLARLPLPKSVLQRVLAAMARENFSQLLGEGKPKMRGLMAYLLTQAGQIAGNAHRKALEKSFAPEPRIEQLGAFDWQLLKSDQPLILPDCVALAVERGGDVYPYMFADIDSIALVLMPVGSDRLLIGQRVAFPGFKIEQFNVLAASCSHEFFIANTNTGEIVSLTRFMGTRSHAAVDKAIIEGMDEHVARSTPMPKFEGDENLLLVPDQTAPFGPIDLDLHFQDCADPETAQKIGDAVSAIAGVIGGILPLTRLEGITFAQDYPGALRRLAQETGRPADSLTPIDKKFGDSVSMAPTVMRNGVAKTRIVMQCWLGHALISEQEEARQAPINVLVGQLAYAGCHELAELRFPGISGIEGADAADVWRYHCTGSAWTGYFAARISAPFGADAGPGYRELLITALEQLRLTLPTARLDYRFHGNLDTLMGIAAEHVGAVLQFAARLIGHYDGMEGQDCFDTEGKLEQALQQLQLRRWFDVYAIDLRKFWDRRTEWKSPKELLALNPHADRLLWPFGIFLWPENGRMRVLVPLQTDAPQLGKAIFKRPLQTFVVMLRTLGKAIAFWLRKRLARSP
jgi:hypothetical protein